MKLLRKVWDYSPLLFGVIAGALGVMVGAIFISLIPILESGR